MGERGTSLGLEGILKRERQSCDSKEAEQKNQDHYSEFVSTSQRSG